VPKDYIRAGNEYSVRQTKRTPRLVNLRGNLHELEPDQVTREQLQEVKRPSLQPDGSIAPEIPSWNGHK
jgi:hypothetical protein